MVTILIILAVVFIFLRVSLYNSDKRQKEKFNNRPSIINSPSSDLMLNQKYAIINILAFAQGANSESAYSNEANEIFNRWLSKLRLSMNDAEKSIQISMRRSPERYIQIIRDSIVEIKDKSFVQSVYHDVKRVAQISGDEDTIEFINALFNDILTH